MSEELVFRYDVDGDDFTSAGQASVQVKRNLRQLGLDSDTIRRVSIAMYEGEINMVIHAGGGVAEVRVSEDCITIVLTDNGPGIKDIEKAMQENMPASVDGIRAKAQELGLTDEQAEEIVGKMYQNMDDLVHGIISPEIFELFAKGQRHDEDVATAREEGMAQGLNKKVEDKLRTLDKPGERISGVQTPVKPSAPKKKSDNMFLDED